MPNPLDYKLAETSSFLIRRKVDRDNKVRLKTPILPSTLGDTTLSSGGFLIPNDFSQDQKDKTANIITILKGNDLLG